MNTATESLSTTANDRRTATAAIFEGVDQPFSVADITVDPPRAGEVMVRVVGTGLCHTDLIMQAGAIPFPTPGVLGHEGAGVVEAVGADVTHVAPGDQVLLTFSSCGSCRQCRGGHPALCELFVPLNLLAQFRADGSTPLHRGGEDVGAGFFGQSSFAGLAVVAQRSVVKLPGTRTEDELAALAPLGCGIQTGIGAIWNVLRPRTSSTLAVYGTGAVGLAAIFAASQLPLETVIAIDVHDHRLELARRFGADAVINAKTDDVAARLGELTAGRGLDYAVEATGNPNVLADAALALGVGGTLGVIGAPSVPGATAPIGGQDLLVGKTLHGITEGDSVPEDLLPVIAAFVDDGRFPLAELVTEYPVAEINRAVEDMHAGTTVKPVIRF